jgi:hypothetical protein
LQRRTSSFAFFVSAQAHRFNLHSQRSPINGSG